MSSGNATHVPLFTQDQLTGKLAKLLVDGPLYKKLRYRGELSSILPLTLSMVCEICDSRTQNWDTLPPNQYTPNLSNLTLSNRFNVEQYKCKNCGKSVVTFIYYWWMFKEPGNVPQFEFAKIGQFPQPLVIVPQVLSKKLNKREIEYYRKALTSRNNSYGLGSLVYLRRIVEDRMNDLLDLLIEAADKDASLDAFKAGVTRVKAKGTFDSKIDVASKLLPARLKPGGINPIDCLHDLASEGIHHLIDEECIDIFDKCRGGFEFVFQELEIQIEHAKAYVDAVRKLTARS
jgi:hypothetical protein